MKLRICFRKYGSMKFIGHLDVMRYFQKAFRRAGIDVVYSQGYSPHQLLSFAAPLSVGVTSDREYLDVQVHSAGTSEELIHALNQVMAEGFLITNIWELPEPSPSSMSLVAAADYRISIRDGYKEQWNLIPYAKEFVELPVISIRKKTKKKEEEMDIKPMIYYFTTNRKEWEQQTSVSAAKWEAETDTKEAFFMRLAAGSVNNLKPDLVMQALCHYAGAEYTPFAFQIHRLEIWAKKETDFLSLGSFGTERKEILSQ